MGKGAMTRGRILDEAMRIASQDGLEGLSIGRLAQALDLSKSGLFAHFGSKEALQVSVLEHTSATLRARVLPVILALPPGPERLRAFLQGAMDWVDDPLLPGGCPIMGACFELDDREGAPREALLAMQRDAQEGIRALFREFVPPSADLDQLAFEYRAILMAYHHAARVMRDPKARGLALRALDHLLERIAGA